MSTVSIQEAERRLTELIRQLKPGDEVVITDNDQPVAKLVGESSVARQPRQRGSAKGQLTIHAEDDEHLKEFGEYIQ